MDQSSCRYYYSDSTDYSTNDISFRSPTELSFPYCSSNILIYWIVNIIMLTIKIILTITRYQRPPKVKLNPTLTKIRLLNWITKNILIALLIICIGTNIANFNNGGSFILYNLQYLSYAFEAFCIWISRVKLGNQFVDVQSGEKLKQFTRFSTMLFISALLFLIISTIAMVFVSPFQTLPQHKIEWAIVGFSSKAVFQFSLSLGLVYHMYRSHEAISKLLLLTTTSSSSTTTTDSRNLMSSSHRYTLNKVLLGIRLELGAYIVFGLLGTIPYIIFASRGVPWVWETIFIPGWIETSLMVFFEFSYLFCKGKLTTENNKDNKNQQVGLYNSGIQQQHQQLQQLQQLQQIEITPEISNNVINNNPVVVSVIAN
jgi:hypothetical protein